ncbi:MAG TPA: alpha/beta hydrolase [Thermomicrobiales bacterium]|nr:alpha/beta hydrolase [Thermomicrobiales bacterium]
MSDVDAHEGSTEVNGVRLAWREWAGGDARPPILLIHGLASSKRIWDLVGPILGRERRVVALDQRGHGESDKPDDGYGVEQVVGDDRALAEALGLRLPVVVGHSWGAAVALAYAALYPYGVSAVVLVDGGVMDMQSRPGASWEQVERDMMPPDYAGAPRAEFLTRMRERRDLPWRPELEEIVLNIVQLREDDTVGPRLSRENHRRILRSLWDFRPADYFESVACPVTIVLADSSTSDERARTFLSLKQQGADAALMGLRRSSDRRLVWLSETAHDIPLHRPAELAAEIEATIATLSDE